MVGEVETMRDKIALASLVALLNTDVEQIRYGCETGQVDIYGNPCWAKMSEWSYAIADEMLKVRQKD